MPYRDQGPLWRTPKKKRHSSPGPGPSTMFDDDDDEEDALAQEIAEHKQQISRHRYRFEAPKTPPKYWDIGFPDTQEVEEINQQAQEMHARKRKKTDSEPRCVVFPWYIPTCRYICIGRARGDNRVSCTISSPWTHPIPRSTVPF